MSADGADAYERTFREIKTAVAAKAVVQVDELVTERLKNSADNLGRLAMTATLARQGTTKRRASWPFALESHYA